MGLMVYILLYVYLFWVLYVLVMGFYRAKLAGRLTGLNLVLAYPIFLFGFVMDVVSQFTFASLVFLEWPKKGEWLVTTRLKRHMAGRGWRQKLAKYICDSILDPFDPKGDHC